MAEDDEGEGLSYQQLVDYLHAGLTKANFPEEIIKDFICLRAHLTHPWGLMHILVNGEQTIAIVRPADDEGLLKVCYIFPTTPLKITDMYGNPADDHFQLLMEPPQANEKPH